MLEPNSLVILDHGTVGKLFNLILHIFKIGGNNIYLTDIFLTIEIKSP